ncbi:multiubiquitin domain-containing protein [Microbacterium sp. HJ5]
MAKEDDKTKTYKIFVNGVEKVVDHDVLTYDEVVRLFVAQPVDGTIYAVSYEHGRKPKEGELVEGGSVTIKNNTQFDVDDTGRS